MDGGDGEGSGGRAFSVFEGAVVVATRCCLRRFAGAVGTVKVVPRVLESGRINSVLGSGRSCLPDGGGLGGMGGGIIFGILDEAGAGLLGVGGGMDGEEGAALAGDFDLVGV